MKIITFWGGLGNQIFEYAYYKWLQTKFPNEKFYAYLPQKGLSDHNGLEINKRFDIEMPPSTLISNIIGYFLFMGMRIARRLHIPFRFICNNSNMNYKRLFHCDYWQDKKYLTNDNILVFSIKNLSRKNEDVLKVLSEPNAVAIHIRRGDYMESGVLSQYGGICTDEYYLKAMNIMEKKISNPIYVFFSDDPDYVKNHYGNKKMIVVDWNIGEDSFYDMYLMSQASNMILANSTFSYWAARFNTKVNLICCPNKWTNFDEPNIILDEWIKIK